MKYIAEHYVELFGILLGLVAVAEIVVRLTPTKKDDGAVERLGQVLRKIQDILKIPNVKKKGDNAKKAE